MSRVSIRFTLLAAALAMVALAVPVQSASAQNGTATASGIPCLCRYDGQDFEQGQCVCMSTAKGPRRACCGMVLNNPSWSFKSDGCHITDLQPDLSHPAGTAPLRQAASTALAGAASFRPASLAPAKARQAP